jgi:phosphoglycerate dehydrogenase-like enzyme
MKIVYFVQNPGIAARTPEGWSASVVTPRSDATYPAAEIDEMAGATVLVVGLEPVPPGVFVRGSLKLIQRLGVGYCNVDLDAAQAAGIPVCNMPDFNAPSVAEHTLMLILALLRRVFESTLLMKGGRWPTNELVGAGICDLAGKTLGLVGKGAIGTAVATKARPFDVRLRYYDHRLDTGDADARERVGSLDDLLGQSDIVSIHLPLTPRTRRLIAARELALMKPASLLINTSRGAIVDEVALADALRDGRLAGAGLDVFETEPLPPRHPLRTCPNVLLTPHLAGQTREAMERMVEALHGNLERVARGEEPQYRVELLTT